MQDRRPTRVYVIATQHLDVAWLWDRVPHGEDLMRMVFELTLHLAESRPDVRFVMSRSTAWGYHVVERRHPHLFHRVQAAVARGSIDLAGGQWVEPDNVIPGGESQIRQALYGQHYYLSRFGRTAQVAWNPDVFGHGSGLPQIYLHAGLEGYYFHRMLPVDEHGQRLGQFIWEAPDGSQVLCYAGNWIGRPDEAALTELFATAPAPALDTVACVAGLRSDRRMTITADWLDLPARMKERLALSECRWGSSVDMLDELRRHRDTLPIIRGELGGYMYTGTYTSDQITKRYNRRLENLLAVVEFTDVWAERETGTCHAGMLAEAWKNLCLNQFHDIICGTCYRSAQEEAHGLYREIDHTAATVVRHAFEALCSRISTDEQPGVPIVVLNDAPLELTAPVTVRATALGGNDDRAASDGALFPGPVSVVTAEGRTVPTMRTEDGVRFLPERVPAYGYRVFYVVTADRERQNRDNELVLQNEYLRVEFDISYGSITSFYDKRTGTEYVKPGGRFNRIVTYEDRNDYPHSPDHRWDPWHIRMTGQEYDPHGAYAVSVLCSGAAGKTIRITRSFRAGDSRHDAVIVQDVSLAPGSPLLRIDVRGDWQAAEAIVKAEFDLAFPVETVVCDMPYAVVERPARIESARSVGAEGAEDRVAEGSLREEPDRPMQMWIDVSNGETGLAILNNGKYGYDSTVDRIRISLMRAPLINEGEIAGLGPFEFSYALLPHAGSWNDAGVPEHAVSFNRDPLVAATWPHAGRLPSQASLFTVSDARVHLSAVKRAEMSAAVVLRLYESSGRASTVRVESRYHLRRAWETNALELLEGARELPVRDRRCIEVSLGEHELKTLVLETDSTGATGYLRPPGSPE